MDSEIIGQGWELMLYGMGTVVMFLALLVIATTLMSRLVGRYFPEPETSAEVAPHKLREQTQAADVPALVAAISAAVHRHRTGKK